MVGLPEVTMAGTLTADPELRYTQSAIAVANFTVACNPRTLNRQTGKWEDGEATFVRCSIWRDAAEHVAESLKRGQRVLVTGSLRQRSYEKDGEKRYAMELDVTEVGASLKWANVEVRKVTRNAGPAGEDSWATRAPAPVGAATGSSGFADEPPF
ncbi:single-stranded DNA-binding protein [Kutzneria buriramensis]|uniref:Single-stranded DNA-binding protein n=1 Tax=Kutzneria buriramensis TaxID=1045776 RepID=A0A3E0GST3_9PSEU|nr:single-stranded DNA-binding protein [Kutzneria buriramensis]REH26005.1 single-strand DNA-binding protein [Kutzneria buriramensis]